MSRILKFQYSRAVKSGLEGFPILCCRPIVLEIFSDKHSHEQVNNLHIVRPPQILCESCGLINGDQVLFGSSASELALGKIVMNIRQAHSKT